MRVSAEEILKISVPIHYTNEEESPAGKASGVIIQHLVTEVEISALPANLPEYLAVDLTELDDGGVVMLSEITLPEGVEIPALTSEEDDIMIANTVRVKESQGTGAAAAEDAAEAELEAAGEVVEGEVPEADQDADADAEGEVEGSEGDKE